MSNIAVKLPLHAANISKKLLLVPLATQTVPQLQPPPLEPKVLICVWPIRPSVCRLVNPAAADGTSHPRLPRPLAPTVQHRAAHDLAPCIVRVLVVAVIAAPVAARPPPFPPARGAAGRLVAGSDALALRLEVVLITTAAAPAE